MTFIIYFYSTRICAFTPSDKVDSTTYSSFNHLMINHSQLLSMYLYLIFSHLNSQPDPSTWVESLGTCPCSFDQGRTDSGFGNGISAQSQKELLLSISGAQIGYDDSLLQTVAGYLSEYRQCDFFV